MSKPFVILAVFCLITFFNGCASTTTTNQITKEQAEAIALEDAPNFKPKNSGFEIYQTEKTEHGWRIMISSVESSTEEASPNIWYEINETGTIIEKENMALGE